MSHQVSLSDDHYQTMAELAAARGQSPEELVSALVDEAWERECARYDAAFEQDTDWRQTAQEASHGRDDAHDEHYPTAAAFVQALGGSDEEIEQAHQLESEQTHDVDHR